LHGLRNAPSQSQEHPLVNSVYFSYHHELDQDRATRIRESGAVEGNPPASGQDWERITRGGGVAIEDWISAQLRGRSCVVVLIGAATAGRMWINHEVRKAWRQNRGVVGVYVHNLEDRHGNQSAKGANPFDEISIEGGIPMLSSIVKAYDPPHSASEDVYRYIIDHIEEWIDEAIAIRRAVPREGRYQPVTRSV
jgi:hypothetical protein